MSLYDVLLKLSKNTNCSLQKQVFITKHLYFLKRFSQYTSHSLNAVNSRTPRAILEIITKV